MSDEETIEQLEHLLRPIHRKLDITINAIGELMADVSKLNEAVTALEDDEAVAAAEFKSLAEQIALLSTSTAPSQEEIDVITQKLTTVAEQLKTATPAPPVVTPPVETPPTETTAETPPSETPPVA